MSLFVLASKDGWVDIMYDGLDAVGVDQQVLLHNCITFYCNNVNTDFYVCGFTFSDLKLFKWVTVNCGTEFVPVIRIF